MLLNLSIKNLATIATADINAQSGLTVITGQTGAGKSLILVALDLVLGGKTKAKLIRHHSKQLEVCAQFDIRTNQPAAELLYEYQLNTDNNICLIRRTISHSGHSKIFINGVSTALWQLKKIAQTLAVLYGQGLHNQLINTSVQQQLFDQYANNTALLAQLNSLVATYQNNQQALKKSMAALQYQKENISLLEYQLNELEQADISVKEVAEIEDKQKRYAHAKQLYDAVLQIQAALTSSNNTSGLLQQLYKLINQLSALQRLDPNLAKISTALEASYLDLEAVSEDIADYTKQLSDIDTQSYQDLDRRLGLLNDLARKHRCQICDLYQVQENLKAQLAELTTNTAKIDNFKLKNETLVKQYRQLSKQISENRYKHIKQFSAEVAHKIRALGMENADFKVALLKKQQDFCANGSEQIDFIVRLNSGQGEQHLATTASGGELSRINLAITALIGYTEAPTLIFDEVDIGISGKTATIIGQQLRILAEKNQVLCITHLAQVAAQAHQHILVQKYEEDAQTYSFIKQLDNKNRIRELARILDGIEHTPAAQLVAKNLLKH